MQPQGAPNANNTSHDQMDTIYGISVGAGACVTTDSNGEILRNELGGHTSASFVAFTPEGRSLGEAAVSGLSANAKGTATQVGRLAVLDYATLTSGDGERTSRHWQFAHGAGSDGRLQMRDVAVTGGETKTVDAVALLGALLVREPMMRVGPRQMTCVYLPKWGKETGVL